MFLSATDNVVLEIVVVVPLTVRFPLSTNDVPVAAPILGVISVGVLAKTTDPLPVSSVRHEARFALDGVAKKVATLVPSPLTPVDIGSPVQEVSVPLVGVPRRGVTRVGEVAKTFAPVPVSSVSAAAKLAELGVARNAATPVPSPLTPVEIGRPVQLVSVPLEGVPRRGVTKVGEVFITKVVPVPVCAATEVAFPTEVIGPVRLAFVVAVTAKSGPPIAITEVATPKLLSPSP